MSWADTYKEYKQKRAVSVKPDGSIRNEIFEKYKTNLDGLFQSIKKMIDGTGITIKTQKTKVSKELHPTLMGDKEELDILILSDSENEMQLIPEGISFIGIQGRVAIKSYKKVFSLQSITEKRLKSIKEPYFVLMEDKDKDNQLTWGVITENTQNSRIIHKLNEETLEKILNETFLS